MDNQLPCNIRIANYICATNKKYENNTCDIQAICLVPLGTSYESYIPQVMFPYVNENFSQIPISVHFAVNQKGETAQFVGVQDVARGLRDYYNPTYPNRPIPTPTNKRDLNCPFIFIGVEIPIKNTSAIETCPIEYTLTEKQKEAIARLICCVMKLYGLTASATTIIDGYSLDSRLDTFFLPSDLIALAVQSQENDCCNSETPPTPTPVPCEHEENDCGCITCEDDTCCPQHKADIAVLVNTVGALTVRVDELETLVASQTAVINNINAQLIEVNDHYQQILDKFDMIEQCFNCLCPQQTAMQRIEYELSGSENWQQLLPLAPTKLKLPIQISDNNPAVANSSSYFIAQLVTPCTYIVQVSLTLETSEYFSGSEVWVDMVSCVGRTKIASQFVSGDGVVSLFGQAPLTPNVFPCNVYFEVFTNDNKDGSRKIEYANVKLQCS